MVFVSGTKTFTFEVEEVHHETDNTINTILVISDTVSMLKCFQAFENRSHRTYSSLLVAPLLDLPKLVWLEAPQKLPQFIRRYEVLTHLLLTADAETMQIVMSHSLPTKTRLISDVLLTVEAHHHTSLLLPVPWEQEPHEARNLFSWTYRASKSKL